MNRAFCERWQTSNTFVICFILVSNMMSLIFKLRFVWMIFIHYQGEKIFNTELPTF